MRLDHLVRLEPEFNARVPGRPRPWRTVRHRVSDEDILLETLHLPTFLEVLEGLEVSTEVLEVRCE